MVILISSMAEQNYAQVYCVGQGFPNFVEGGPDNNETISLRAGQIIQS